MAVLSRKKRGSAVIVKNTRNPSSEGAGNKARERIAAATLQNRPPLVPAREEKVLGIRKQLAKGTYDLDEHLDAVLESLLADLTA